MTQRSGMRVRTPEDLGRAIRALRHRSMLTQRHLAELSGVDRSLLAKIEAGRANRLLEHELRLLRRLGAEVRVDFRDLLPDAFDPDEIAAGLDREVRGAPREEGQCEVAERGEQPVSEEDRDEWTRVGAAIASELGMSSWGAVGNGEMVSGVEEMSIQDLLARLDRTADNFYRELTNIVRWVTYAVMVGDAVALDRIGLRQGPDGMESVVLEGEVVPRVFWAGETQSRRGFGGVHDLGRPELFTADCFRDEFLGWGMQELHVCQIVSLIGNRVWSMAFISKARSELMRYLSRRLGAVGKG